MQTDLLSQLRDLHLPVEPNWWPPAPGYWFLAMVIAGLIWWAFRALQLARLRRRPFRQALALYRQLHQDYRDGTVGSGEYLHRSNELLKRLVIFGMRQDQARSANDQDWLSLLDRLSNSQAFTSGPGQALGNQRFSSAPEADIDALHPLLERFFEAARP